ncbi:MAG: aminoacyl-tRNA hydrolase [Geminicoccaceae bacterium]|nr:aminoacyl-tRNA hydrolase [Geminicoccaceae bacterium]
MRLLVGLGNPGERHARQRHNIGFMALDAIVRRHGLPAWRRKFQGMVTEGMLPAVGGARVLLLEPATFMNLSGRAVAEAARFHKIAPADLIVFHDELDLAPGKVRVKLGGGTAGHNGLRSIDASLGSREFRRVRMGIGHPGDKERVTGHVLGDFAKADREWLEPLLDAVAEAVPLLAAGDDAGFMNRVALRTRPPREEIEDGPPRGRAAPRAE